MKKALPPQYPFLETVKDRSNPQDIRIAIRGDRNNRGEVAPRGFVSILSKGEPKPFTKGSGRLELAEAIADPENPLTARVMVNRIWQHHFGRAIVETPSNYGQMGERPSNPELLDYLAARFVENKWSIKAMHREIMLSSVYALSAENLPANCRRRCGQPAAVARELAAPGRRVAARFAAVCCRQSRSHRRRAAGPVHRQQQSPGRLRFRQPVETESDHGAVRFPDARSIPWSSAM